jgi:hypothetical protein
LEQFAPQEEDAVAQVPAMVGPGDMGGAVQSGVQAPQDAVVEAARWVCVTGLVPYRDQLAKYTEEFSTAQHQDPTKDVPYWLGYLVERAEVTGNLKDPTKWEWKGISVSGSKNFSLRWAVRASEVVDPGYTDENLTFPLGPLLERNWDKGVAHSKIPVLDVSQRGMTGGDTGVAVEAESASIADIAQRAGSNDLEEMLKRRNTRTLTNPGGEGLPGARVVAPRTAVSRMPGGGYGEGSGGYSPRMAYQGEGGDESYASTGDGTQEAVEYLLFRFFDFSVEEGKQYSYRVQLVLENPNYRVRPQYLKDASFARDEVKKSPWSEPSQIGAVSSFNELYAGPVEPAKTATLEPEANMIAVQLDPKLGTMAVYEMRKNRPGERGKREMPPVKRGQPIKFSAKVDVVHPLTRIPTEETVAFDAKKVVVDMRGGERFDPVSINDRDTFPGEVLTMDPNGWLSAHSEAADEPTYVGKADWLFMLEEAKKTNSQAPFGNFPGDEGGEGSDGGEGGFPFRGRRGPGS